MKRLIACVLLLMIILTISGCSKAFGGSYTLTKITKDGTSFTPSSLGMNFHFTLGAKGSGSASFNSAEQTITWVDNGNTITIEGNKKTLEFTKDGKNLILYDDGMVLYFTLDNKSE